MKNTKCIEKNQEPHYAGHRKRLRSKYLNSPKSLADYELIELLLTYVISRKDVKPIAKKLLAQYGSIGSLLTAPACELITNKYISENAAVLFGLVRELALGIFAENIKEKDLFQSPSEVMNFAIAKLSGLKDEAFLVLYVNTKNRLEAFEIVNEGTVDHVVIYPRRVIKQALKHNATGLIIVHNHPSGECDPSSHDIRLTESLRKAADAMEIKLIDHIIIGGNRHFSFLEENLL